jgi:hypothetical protein
VVSASTSAVAEEAESPSQAVADNSAINGVGLRYRDILFLAYSGSPGGISKQYEGSPRIQTSGNTEHYGGHLRSAIQAAANCLRGWIVNQRPDLKGVT